MLLMLADLMGVIPEAPEAVANKLQFFSVQGSNVTQCGSNLNLTQVFAYDAACYPSFIQANPTSLVPAQNGMQCPAISFKRASATNNILLQVRKFCQWPDAL